MSERLSTQQIYKKNSQKEKLPSHGFCLFMSTISDMGQTNPTKYGTKLSQLKEIRCRVVAVVLLLASRYKIWYEVVLGLDEATK